MVRITLTRVFFTGRYKCESFINNDRVMETLSKRDKIFIDNNRSFDIGVEKKVILEKDSKIDFEHRISKFCSGPLRLKYAVELNFSICDKRFLSKPHMEFTEGFLLTDLHSSIKLDFLFNRRLMVYKYPVYSINETEDGLTKTYQGISILIGDEFYSKEENSSDNIRCSISINM